MVDDLGYQLDLVKQFDHRTADERLQQLAVALDRWNTSTRTEHDFDIMAAWLEAAIQASLPGHTKQLPELPWFAERLAGASRPPSTKVVTPPAATEAEPPAVEVPRPLPRQPTFAHKPESIKLSVPPPPVVVAPRRQPVAKPAGLGDPFADDPLLQAAAVPHTAQQLSTVAARPASAKVDVNVAELGARIRGYVHGLRGVEARLLRASDMTTEQLLHAVRELRQLAGQREFVLLYLGVLSTAERARTPELPTTQQAKTIVSQRIESLRSSGQLTSGAEETLESMLQEI